MSDAILNTTDLTAQLQNMSTAIGRMPDGVVKTAAKNALSRYGRLFVREMVKSIGGSVSDDSVLHRRTGALARAFNHTVVTTGKNTSLYIWIDSTVKDYWMTHEFGATIRPKYAKALAIPVGDALTKAGVPRFNSPRDVPDLFLINRKAFGKAPLLGKAENGKIRIYYVLKKSVKVKPRLGFRVKWSKGIPTAISIFETELRSRFKEGLK